jgi:hypothetical protein
MGAGDVVWIVGAGFSKPLGGPLLNELFPERVLSDLEARFDAATYPTLHQTAGVPRLALEAAVWLFTSGAGKHLWEDAEQFLSRLGKATTQHPDLQEARKVEARRLEGPLREFLQAQAASHRFERETAVCLDDVWTFTRMVSNEARRLMAAQCSAFMLTAPTGKGEIEDWAPFERWGQGLTDHDTVITLNYDCAAEAAAGDKLMVVTDAETGKPGERARLFKLHGSTDWLKVWNGSYDHFRVLRNPQWACLTAEPERIVIGSPGPEKRRTAEYLKPLWDGAMEAIRTAGAVVFVGYRFPDTDADAREKICEAIGASTTGWLHLHTVLGPDIASHASVRLGTLLRSRFHGRHEMRAEDRVDKKEPHLSAGAYGYWYNLKAHACGSQDLNHLGDLFGDPR